MDERRRVTILGQLFRKGHELESHDRWCQSGVFIQTKSQIIVKHALINCTIQWEKI